MSEDYTPNMVRLLSAYFGDQRIECHRIPDDADYDRWEAEFDRAIAAHDAELREQIAREIEAHGKDSGVGAYGTYGPPAITVSDAASIARGKTGEVKRCLQCGCDLRYPTAVHIVDCGPRKEQD